MKQQVSVMAGDCLSTKSSAPFIAMAGNPPFDTPTKSETSQQAISSFDIEFPIFEEATQMASHILDIPVCVVGIPQGSLLVLKAATGLSQLGLMNPLARNRRLPLEDELTHPIIQAKQRLILPEIDEEESFSQSILVQEYGIRAYLGMPLLTTEGHCIGLLAAMGTQCHEFSKEAIAFMELLARWSVSEYERDLLSRTLSQQTASSTASPDALASAQTKPLDTVRLTLMNQLTQEMRTPLTTITGMASMLSREIYGSLTPKQREYTEIVHNSSQTLLEMASQVLELSDLGMNVQSLNAAAIDFELLGQHVAKKLAPMARENHQEIRLTVEPESRLWKLDKDIVRQLLYHLIFSVIKLSREGGTVRVHSSGRDNVLTVAVWVSHPWLGEGLPASALALRRFLSDAQEDPQAVSQFLAEVIRQAGSTQEDTSADQTPENALLKSRETLSLLLSRCLIEHHGGSLTLKGNVDSGYRFLVALPSL